MKNVFFREAYLGLLSIVDSLTKKAKSVVETLLFSSLVQTFFPPSNSTHVVWHKKTFHTQFVITQKRKQHVFDYFSKPARLEVGWHPRNWACACSLMTAIRWSPVTPSIRNWEKLSRKPTWSACSVSQSTKKSHCHIFMKADKSFLLTKSFPFLRGFQRCILGRWAAFFCLLFCSDNLGCGLLSKAYQSPRLLRLSKPLGMLTWTLWSMK